MAVVWQNNFDMTSRRSQLHNLTQREIANKLGLSTSGLNYCRNALIDKGWVKVHNFSQSKYKFGYIYVLTPQGILEKISLTSRFLKRKLNEYEALKNEIEGLQCEIENSQISQGA